MPIADLIDSAIESFAATATGADDFYPGDIDIRFIPG
jgi:hypothetical protein